MQLAHALAGLLALAGASTATPISGRQTDPIIFTYQVGQNPSITCSNAPFGPLQEFSESQVPAGGCVVLADILGNATPVSYFFLFDTFELNGICKVKLYKDGSCAEQATSLTSLHCATGEWKSFSLENCL